MHRRAFISLLAAIAFTPMPARAQQRVFKIGLLDTGLSDAFAVPFFRKLEQLGYVDGKNVVIERKSAAGNKQLLAGFADELVRDRVDVIVTVGTPAGFAAKKA